jgi:crotonobetaine/carnitine-CoA ligase
VTGSVQPSAAAPRGSLLPGVPRLPADLTGLNVRDFLEETAGRVPDRIFVLTRQRSLTYGEFNNAVNRAASTWQNLGVAKEDRVGFVMGNGIEFLVAWLALAKLGAVLVAVNPRFTTTEVRTALEVAGVGLVLIDDHLEPPKVEQSTRRIWTVSDFVRLTASASDEFNRPVLSAYDVVSLIFTSGTTGRPKAVMQTHGNWVLTGQAFPWWLGLDKGSRFYCCLPLFHANAQAYSTMGAIANEGTLVLVERFSASRFWEDVTRYEVDAINYIGAMMSVLMAQEPSPRERDHGVKIGFGAPRFPEPQLREIEDRFGFPLIAGHGMSETTFGLIESIGDRRAGSIGTPRLHPDPRLTNQVRVVDENGDEVHAGEVGELLYRNPMLMRGYFGDVEATAEAIRDGWLHTGDYVSHDADGYFTFVDRKKDVVRRRGENVSSLEVELTVMAHPSVAEAAVVGVAAEMTDEELFVFVVPRPGVTCEPVEIVRWCAERLAAYKVPRYVLLIQSLPRTPTQKIEKRSLRNELADREAAFDSERGH